MEDQPISQPTQPEAPKQKIRQCPHCGQPMPIKSVWQQLWRWPTFQEWLILFMMVMMFVIAWAYNHDTAICRNYVKNIDLICLQRGMNQSSGYLYHPNIDGVWIVNGSNVTLKNSSMFGNNSIYVSNLNTSVSNGTT